MSVTTTRQQTVQGTHRRFLRPRPAAEYLGISIRQLYRVAKADDSFPKLLRLSANTVVIERAALDAWADAKTGATAEVA